jgi:hypothetical protein
MYNISNLGTFAAHVRAFADIDGYVPEPGDSPDDFRWDGGEPPHDWPVFIEGAVKATRVANASAARWQGVPHGELVKTAVRESGRQLQDVAAALGISPGALTQRLDRKSVSVETVEDVGRIIGWSIPEIVGE